MRIGFEKTGDRTHGAVAVAFVLVAALWLAVAGAHAGEPLAPDRQRFLDAYTAFEAGDRAVADAGFASLSGGPVLGDLADWFRMRIAFQDRDYARAVSLCDRLIAGLPAGERSRTARMYRALALVSAGRAGEAIEQYLDIRDRYPEAEPDRLLLRLGSAYEAQGLYRKAERSWQTIVWLYPSSPNRKEALDSIQRMRKARGMAMAEPDADLLYQTLVTYQETSRTEDTILYSNKFLRLYPLDPRAPEADLIAAYAEIRRGLYDAATKRLLAAKKPAKGRRAWRAQRAYLLARAKGPIGGDDREEIRRLLVRVADRYPTTEWAARALELVGMSWWDEEKFGRAAGYYERAYLAHPEGGDRELQGWRAGWGRFLDGDYGRAASMLEAYAAAAKPGADQARAFYWAGRALQERGRTSEARGFYERLLAQYALDYYAFCARERMAGLYSRDESDAPRPEGREAILYALAHVEGEPAVTLPRDLGREAALATLRGRPAGAEGRTGERIEALLAMGVGPLVVEELRVLAGAAADDPLALYAVAVLYREVGEPLESVRVANGLHERLLAGEIADPAGTLVTLRMPFDYWDLVSRYAGETGLDPQFVMAVIRQESAFDTRAHSRADARGLMQVIPSTGRRIARDLKVSPFRPGDLFDPETSIRFGTYYLASVRARFGGDRVAALAGYNAGPGRPARWWPKVEGRPYDEAIERIPFRETRGYVKNILRNDELYRHWYAGTPGAPPPGPSVFGLITQPVPALPKPE